MMPLIKKFNFLIDFEVIKAYICNANKSTVRYIKKAKKEKRTNVKEEPFQSAVLGRVKFTFINQF